MTERWAESLVACGLLGQQELSAAERAAAEKGLRLQDSVVALGTLSEDQVCAAIADDLGLPLVFPYASAIDPRLIARFPLALLHRLEAVPLHEEEGGIVVALARPGEARAREELERAAGAPIQAVMAAPRRIHSILEDLAVRARAVVPGGGEGEDARRTRSDPAAIRLLFGKLAFALREEAAELRFDPTGGVGGGQGPFAGPEGPMQRGVSEAERGPPFGQSGGEGGIAARVRRAPGGPLEDIGRGPLGLLTALVARARILAGEPGSQGPLARRLRTRIGGRAVDLAVSILPSRGGESVRLGLRRPPRAPASVEEAGLPAAELERIQGAIAAGRGFIRLGGDEYGAAATAYAIGRSADPVARAVVTLERTPLEREPRFRQVELPPGARAADLIGACLAHEPDVLYVGEGAEEFGLAALELAARERLILVRG